jgi:hypothetical protein
MDRIANPFAPGAGTEPPELAGRNDVLAESDVAIKRAAAGKASRCLILTGLRGVGKTVLLVRIRKEAERAGHHTVMVEAHDRRPLPALLAPALQEVLTRFNKVAKAKALALKAMTFLHLFASTFTIQVGDAELGLGARALMTGDLEQDLPTLFQAVGEAARAAGQTVIGLIDEMQSLNRIELSALIIAMHKVAQEGLPIVLIGAALPHIRAAAGESNAFTERQFQYIDIGALNSDDAWWAVRRPVEANGATISNAALREILRRTGGYPYFIQQWASDSWNRAEGPEITLADVRAAELDAIDMLDRNLFRVRYERCTPPERQVMAAMASLKARPDGYVLDEVQAALPEMAAAEFRKNLEALIEKGMVYHPSNDRLAFTVPLFDDFMRRVRI